MSVEAVLAVVAFAVFFAAWVVLPSFLKERHVRSSQAPQ